MRYCLTYNPKLKYDYINEVDEITILYRRSDTTLLEFMLLHKDQRVNIFVEDITDFVNNDCAELFKAIAAEHPELNFAFLFSYSDERAPEMLYDLREAGLKYFFTAFVKDWDALYFYKNLQPIEMFITDALGFELPAVKSVLEAEDIGVRCFANIAQATYDNGSPLKKFFIRPEDVGFYSQYVDVIEFYCEESKAEVYYKIYKHDGKWFGKLREIITGLDSDIDSRFILPVFAERRASCGKRCLKGRPCNLCITLNQTAAVLKESNLMVKPRQ